MYKNRYLNVSLGIGVGVWLYPNAVGDGLGPHNTTESTSQYKRSLLYHHELRNQSAVVTVFRFANRGFRLGMPIQHTVLRC